MRTRREIERSAPDGWNYDKEEGYWRLEEYDPNAKIDEQIKNKEFRKYFATDTIGIAFQMRAMRFMRKWTQKELSRRSGIAQSRISLFEGPSYENYSVATLKKLANAFDVALIVRFAPISELIEYNAELSGPAPLSLNKIADVSRGPLE